MSLSTNQSLIRGTFTSDGVSETINVPWLPTFFKTRNITQFGSAAAATPVMIAERTIEMPQGSALTYTKTTGAATLDLPTMNLADGMIFRDQSTEVPGPELTGTSITAANPAVVTITAHGLVVGDSIRLYNTTGMLQIAGMEYSVTNVLTANTFEIFLDSSGFAAPATALNARTIPFTNFYPRFMWITGITQATQAVIQTSFIGVTGDLFAVDQLVTLKVPPEFGMVEANDLRVRVVAFNNATGTLTVDLNTTGFTAFAFPTSATAANGVNFPQVVPFGNVALGLALPVANQWDIQVILGTNAIGGNNDVMEWLAARSLLVETTSL